jgi:REP element-mobilizing transposase RayT
VPTRLKRYYGAQHLHFITCSCYHRLPILGTAGRRDSFLQIFEQTRQKYQFVVYGYVVMPEHFHLLLGEPEKANPSVLMKVVKQRFARRLRHKHRRPKTQMRLWADTQDERVWQKRSTISMCGAIVSESKNYATSTGIL